MCPNLIFFMIHISVFDMVIGQEELCMQRKFSKASYQLKEANGVEFVLYQQRCPNIAL